MYEFEIQERGYYFYSFSEAEFSFCCLFWHSLLRYWCFYYNFIFEKKNVKILTSPVPCTSNKLFLFLLFVKNFYVCSYKIFYKCYGSSFSLNKRFYRNLFTFVCLITTLQRFLSGRKNWDRISRNYFGFFPPNCLGRKILLCFEIKAFFTVWNPLSFRNERVRKN